MQHGAKISSDPSIPRNAVPELAVGNHSCCSMMALWSIPAKFAVPQGGVAPGIRKWEGPSGNAKVMAPLPPTHRCQLSPNFGDGPQNDSSVPKSPMGH